MGEVGLGGEIRNVNRLENRVKEASKLGFSKVFSSQASKDSKIETLQIIGKKQLRDVFAELFG